MDAEFWENLSYHSDTELRITMHSKDVDGKDVRTELTFNLLSSWKEVNEIARAWFEDVLAAAKFKSIPESMR